MRVMNGFRKNFWVLLVVVSVWIAMPAEGGVKQEQRWYDLGPQGEVTLDLYFFWSEKCPHCEKALPFAENLSTTYPWLKLFSFPVDDHPENSELFSQMATALGQDSIIVPAFVFCDSILMGYQDDATTGKFLDKKLLLCRENVSWMLAEGLDHLPKKTEEQNVRIHWIWIAVLLLILGLAGIITLIIVKGKDIFKKPG